MAVFARMVLVLLLVAPSVGCHASEKFESVCQVVRQSVVDRDEKGVATLLDVELEWDPCPGDQFQVVRGGKEFAACMAKYDKGDFVPVHVTHHWDDRGFYTWGVTRVGDCGGDIDGQLEGSYEKSQECSSVTHYGNAIGFSCSRRPFRKLVQVCPWMAR